MSEIDLVAAIRQVNNDNVVDFQEMIKDTLMQKVHRAIGVRKMEVAGSFLSTAQDSIGDDVDVD